MLYRHFVAGFSFWFGNNIKRDEDGDVEDEQEENEEYEVKYLDRKNEKPVIRIAHVPLGQFLYARRRERSDENYLI